MDSFGVASLEWNMVATFTEIHTLTHKSFIKVGFWALGSYDFTNITFTPYITIGSTTNASMGVQYTVKLVPLGYFGEYNSEYNYAYSTWDVNFKHLN